MEDGRWKMEDGRWKIDALRSSILDLPSSLRKDPALRRHELVERRKLLFIEELERDFRALEISLDSRKHLERRVGRAEFRAAGNVARAGSHLTGEPDQVEVHVER